MRPALGRLRIGYSTWPAEFQQPVKGDPEPGRFRGTLFDDLGAWWHCGHRHLSGTEATRCGREQNRLQGPLGEDPAEATVRVDDHAPAVR